MSGSGGRPVTAKSNPGADDPFKGERGIEPTNDHRSSRFVEGM
jgi:hypothetical protein